MLLAFTGVFSQGLAPFVVHGLTTLGNLSLSQAGLCVGAEMAGNAVGVTAVLFLVAGMRRHRLAILALVGILVGNGWSVIADSPLAYLFARSVAGLGAGLTTFAFGTIATFPRPARNFAIFSGLSVCTMASADAMIPGLLARAGLPGLFGLLAVPAVVALVLSGLLPEKVEVAGALRMALPRGAMWTPAALGLFTNLCFFTALAAFWTFAAEIALAKGDAAISVGQLLGTAFLLGGILGSTMAVVASSRIRPSSMIGVGAAAMSASVAAMVWFSNFDAFAVALCVYLLFWFTSYPFLMALLAELDSAGGLTILGVLTQSAGWLVGPALGSVLVAGGGSYGRLGILCCTGFLVATIGGMTSRMRARSL